VREVVDESAKTYLAKQRRRNAIHAAKSETFWVRLQFNLAKRLEIAGHSKDFQLAGRRVRLSAFDREAMIRDSDRLVFTARGFPTKEEAEQFGRSVQRAIAITSLGLNLGADVGFEAVPTSHISQAFADLDPELKGFYLRTTVQGVTSYSSRENTLFVNINATATVTMKPDRFIGSIRAFLEASGRLDDNSFVAAILMNEAMVSSEPHSQILLAISAVESLAQSEKWSPSQRQTLARLKEYAANITGLTEVELAEVIEAVENMRNFGVGAKCRRLIREVGLAGLLDAWTNLYTQRSQIVHGLRYVNRQKANEISNAARTLCGRIVTASIARHVRGLAKMAAETYPFAG
jgi:hypothetical protein